MRFLIAVMIVAVFVSVAPEVRANPKIGIHAGADTGFPLVGAGITSEVIGVRHVFEYPIWELTPSFMLSFAVKDVEYSLGVTFGLVSELDCDDEYCDSFDFPQMGLRFGYRPSLEGNLQWRVGLSFSSTLIVAPGFIYDLISTRNFDVFTYFDVPIAITYGVGVAVHGGIGVRFGFNILD